MDSLPDEVFCMIVEYLYPGWWMDKSKRRALCALALTNRRMSRIARYMLKRQIWFAFFADEAPDRMRLIVRSCSEFPGFANGIKEFHAYYSAREQSENQVSTNNELWHHLAHSSTLEIIGFCVEKYGAAGPPPPFRYEPGTFSNVTHIDIRKGNLHNIGDFPNADLFSPLFNLPKLEELSIGVALRRVKNKRSLTSRRGPPCLSLRSLKLLPLAHFDSLRLFGPLCPNIESLRLGLGESPVMQRNFNIRDLGPLLQPGWNDLKCLSIAGWNEKLAHSLRTACDLSTLMQLESLEAPMQLLFGGRAWTSSDCNWEFDIGKFLPPRLIKLAIHYGHGGAGIFFPQSEAIAYDDTMEEFYPVWPDSSSTVVEEELAWLSHLIKNKDKWVKDLKSVVLEELEGEYYGVYCYSEPWPELEDVNVMTECISEGVQLEIWLRFPYDPTESMLDMSDNDSEA